MCVYACGAFKWYCYTMDNFETEYYTGHKEMMDFHSNFIASMFIPMIFLFHTDNDIFNGTTLWDLNSMKLTMLMIAFVSLYISFVNSMLEEFFFRGFAFLTLKRLTGRKFAYIFSASVFAIYHIAMMTGWFGPLVFLIIMAGLFSGGLIFDYLNEKSSSVYPSWIVHMFANFAINTVGFILFGII